MISRFCYERNVQTVSRAFCVLLLFVWECVCVCVHVCGWLDASQTVSVVSGCMLGGWAKFNNIQQRKERCDQFRVQSDITGVLVI